LNFISLSPCFCLGQPCSSTSNPMRSLPRSPLLVVFFSLNEFLRYSHPTRRFSPVPLLPGTFFPHFLLGFDNRNCVFPVAEGRPRVGCSAGIFCWFLSALDFPSDRRFSSHYSKTRPCELTQPGGRLLFRPVGFPKLPLQLLLAFLFLIAQPESIFRCLI